MEFSYWQLLFFSLSSVQVSLWRCSLWNDMNGYAVVSGACRVAILDTKRFGQSLNEKPDPQLQGKREWILERAPVNAGPSPWTARGWCVGQHLLCAFGSAAAKRIWGVLTQVKHFVKRPSGPPTQKQTWPMEFSYWQLLFFSLSSVQVSLWRCSLWNDMNGYAVVSGAWRVAILDTKRFGQSLNEKPDPQLQGKREWILERAPVNAGPSPWTARGWCVGQHLLCAFGSPAAKRIWGVLTQVMFMCCFSSSLTLGMPLARSWRPLWGLEPVDTRSFRSARRRIMAIGKFMIDIRYLIFATPRVAVKDLHTFWVVYPPKASLRSDILEARHHVRSFNLPCKLLNKAQKQSEPLTRSDLASLLGLATSKSYGTGDLISKRVVEEKVLSILAITQYRFNLSGN